MSDDRDYVAAIGCVPCRGENLIYCGPVRTDQVDGNGNPKDETREWWHDGFPVEIAARSTLDPDVAARALHDANPKEAAETIATLATVAVYTAGNPEPEVIAVTGAGTTVEYVSIPAAEWDKIERLIRMAGLLHDEWYRIGADQYRLGDAFLNQVYIAYSTLPDHYKRPIIATGGPVSGETHVVGESDGCLIPAPPDASGETMP